MKLADAHLHLFRQGYAARYGPAWANHRELELYHRIRHVHNIAAGLVVGFEGEPQFRGNNRDVARWARENPWITPLAYTALESPPNLKQFVKWRSAGFAGLSLYVLARSDAERLNRWSEAAFQWLNETGAILSINTRPEALAMLGPFIARLERCPILISHLGSPGRFKQIPSRREAKTALHPLVVLSRLPRVGVKLSGFYAITAPSHQYPHASARPLVSELYDQFGPSRLLWGSDFSPALEHVSFAQTIDVLLQFGWSSSELQAIMHDNLVELIRRSRRSLQSKAKPRLQQ